MKTRGLYPCQPSSLLSILALSIGLFGSSSAMAETEVEALRRELAEQKEVIRQILAAQQAQKEVSAKVDAQAKAAAETPTNGTAAQAVASALQNVTIYGVLDGGFEHITNIGS